MQGILISLLGPTFGKPGAEQAALQVQVSLLEAKAAVLACQKLRLALLEPPADVLEVLIDPATGARKPQNSAAHLQQLAPQVCSLRRLVTRLV